MVALKPACAGPFDAQAVDGEVVLLARDGPVATALTPEAALRTAEMLRAAGLAAMEQKGYRRAEPNSGRIRRPPSSPTD